LFFVHFFWSLYIAINLKSIFVLNYKFMEKAFPIGVFDSGYGGLTVLREIRKKLPQYDYIYLGDNARAPYGSRSFDVIHRYTLQAVQWFFDQGCALVILACNTASAKALRTIQQKDLPNIAPDKRVLGVIRPVTEAVGYYSTTKHIGILGTEGTVNSGSYPIEIEKFFPELKVVQEACPMWVPLIENFEFNSNGADYFVKKHIKHILTVDKKIDTLVLACTHYPVMMNKISHYAPQRVRIISQGEIVADSLSQYLQRHPEREALCSKNKSLKFYTTDRTQTFDRMAQFLFDEPVNASQVTLS
jgi:glutamate racemase